MSTLSLSSTRTTDRLLAAGVVTGPLFVVTVAVQALTKQGFDLTRHPLSLLSLGEHGWIQIANFVVAGILGVAFAAGVARAVDGGPASTWAPRLLLAHGAGLLLGGIFTADPGLGYPAGAPEGIPATMSFHGTVHAVAPILAFLSLVAACLVVARRFAAQRRTAAAVTTRVVAVACLLLSVPVGPGASVRLFAAVALGFAWIAALAVDLRRAVSDAR